MVQALGARGSRRHGRRRRTRRARRARPPRHSTSRSCIRRSRTPGWRSPATSTTRSPDRAARPRSTARRRAPTPNRSSSLDAALDALGRRRRTRRPARIGATLPAPARPAGSGFAAAAILGATAAARRRAGARSHRVSTSGSPSPTSSSPARARWTSRPCTARRRRASRAPPGRAGVPVVAVAGRCGLDADSWRSAGFDAVYTLERRGLGTRRIVRPRRDRSCAASAHSSRSGCRMSLDVVFRAQRAIVDGAERACAIGVQDGRIAAVEPLDADRVRAADRRGRARRACCCPAWSTRTSTSTSRAAPSGRASTTATRAAAAGGVTTIIDMPLNSIPPTTTLAGAGGQARLRGRRRRTSTSGSGAARCPATSRDLRRAARGGRVRLQVLPASTPASPEFPPLDAEQFCGRDGRDRPARRAAHRARRGRRRDRRRRRAGGPAYAAFLRSRPHAAEERAIAHRDRRGERHAAAAPTSLHLSSADALPQLRAARAAGVDVTVETCPHYLAVDAGAHPRRRDRSSSAARRSATRANQDRLWAALAAGDIDLIVSDHSPCTAELKRLDTGDFGAGLGRDRLGAARAAGGVDGRAGPRARPRPTSCAGWPPHRPTGSGSPTRAGSRSAPTPTWCVFASGRAVRGRSGRTCCTRTRCRAYAGRELTGRGPRRPGCAASGSTRAANRAANCSRRGRR